ncbi:glycosyltransferase [Streptomycetaceae bacterium NBC_01309]
MNDSPTLVAVAMALSLLLGTVFLGYLVSLVVCFVRNRAQPPGDHTQFEWHILVPCLNEAAVVGESLRRLRSEFPTLHIWAIDDDSDDATADIIRAHQKNDIRIHLVARRAPHARTGKGDALNAAYQALCDWLPDGLSPDRVIVGVFDADGVPAPGLLDTIAADHLFGSQDVAAVQIEVRMLNRDEQHPVPGAGRLRNLAARTLVRMQDMEFRTTGAAVQLGRRATRTVALGGNGQFARLSALHAVSDDLGPWGSSLLEDYELGLRLKLAGHNSAFTRDTWVGQEALWSLRQLLTQRVRWGQGTMQCVRYMPHVWRSRTMTTAGVLEIAYSVFQPWFQLFASILYPLLLMLLVLRYAAHPEVINSFLADGGWGLLPAYFVFGVAQFGLWGPLYWRRCEPQAGFWRSLGWGFAYSAYIWLYWIATWRALARFTDGRNTWAKTRRNAEIAAIHEARAGS